MTGGLLAWLLQRAAKRDGATIVTLTPNPAAIAQLEPITAKMSRRPPRGEYIETVRSYIHLPLVGFTGCHNTDVGLLQDTGNKVARKANLVGTQNIMLGGKTVIQPEAMIRGDLARSVQPSSSSGGAPASNTAVAIGRYCFLSRGCCLRPPGRLYKG